MTTSRLSIGVLTCALAAGAPPAPRPYSVKHYDAEISVDFGARRVAGIVSMRILSESASLRAVELDANDLMIAEARRGRTALGFSQFIEGPTGEGRALIRLDKPLARGEQTTLRVRYSGAPTKGLRFFGDQAYTVFHTSYWLVVNSRPGNLATLRLSISVPRELSVIANGVQVSQRLRGDRLISVWDERRAIPSFVFGFAAGRFVESRAAINDVTLRFLGVRHSASEMQKAFSVTGRALEFFAARAGVRYPGRSYSQTLVRGEPKQELGDFTILPEAYGDRALADPEDAWLIAHELAHQWWGIGVACQDWSDFWLNEGVATFMADAFLGQEYGQARYDREIAASRKVFEKLKAAGEDRPLSYHDWTTARQAGGSIPYDKGAWALHLLRERIGDDAFWRGLQAYTRQHWGGTVTSPDLQRAMEQASGQELDAFFEEWVYGPRR